MNCLSLHVELSSHPFQRTEYSGGRSTWYRMFQITVGVSGELTYWDDETETERPVQLVDADMAELRALIDRERVAHPRATYLGAWGYPTRPGAQRRLYQRWGAS